MRTFAPKQNRPQDQSSLNPKGLNIRLPIQSHEWHPVPQLRSASSNSSMTNHFAHDFSRIPVHAKTPAMIQPKLAVRVSEDNYEREADYVSEVVVNEAHSETQSSEQGGSSVARQCMKDGTDIYNKISAQPLSPSLLQSFIAPPIVNRALNTPGKPIHPEARAAIEPRLGHDFSRVRVHADGEAVESADAIGALAYTVGNHIVFGRGQYQPTTKPGLRLLSHELTHVLQQTNESKPMLQRQVDKGKEGGLKKGGKIAITEGKLEVKQYSPTHQMIEADVGRVYIEIKLAFTREAGSRYLDPSKINWLQTYRTNYETDSSEVPPADTEIKDYVDGPDYKDKQEARFYNKINGSNLSDILPRSSLKDRDVYWKVETSAVGISDNGLELLGTVEWGFKMDRKGTPTYFPLRAVTTPSAYHLLKFQELRAKEE